MANVTTISTAEGTITIDSKEFTNFNQRALQILEQISELQLDFKEVAEEAATKTGMKPAKVGGYFKARHAAKTKEAKAKGELFEQLDNALDN